MKTFYDNWINLKLLRFDYLEGDLIEVRSRVEFKKIEVVGDGTYDFVLGAVHDEPLRYESTDHMFIPPYTQNMLVAIDYFSRVTAELLRLEKEISELRDSTDYVKDGKKAIEARMQELGFSKVLAHTD